MMLQREDLDLDGPLNRKSERSRGRMGQVKEREIKGDCVDSSSDQIITCCICLEQNAVYITEQCLQCPSYLWIKILIIPDIYIQKPDILVKRHVVLYPEARNYVNLLQLLLL